MTRRYLSLLVAAGLTLVGCASVPLVDEREEPTSEATEEPPPDHGQDDEADEEALEPPAAEEPVAPTEEEAARSGTGGLQRGEGTRGSDLSPGGGVEAPPLERRALELFSDLDATDTPEGALVEVPDDVLFAFDDDQLRADADRVIADLIELAELTAEVPIEVIGHTDGIGDDAYNLDLSQRRADAVIEALITGGVDPARVEAIGRGSTEPLREEGGADDEEARARNRRVEVVFHGVALDD